MVFLSGSWTKEAKKCPLDACDDVMGPDKQLAAIETGRSGIPRKD